MKWIHGVAVTISGLAVGWIAGMSESPVASAILAAILGALIAVVSGFQESSGFEIGPALNLVRSASPVPFAVLSVSLAAGIASGIYTRTHHLLTPAPEHVVQQWVAYGIDSTKAVTRIFDMYYPEGGVLKGGLMTGQADADECKRVRFFPLDTIVTVARASSDAAIAGLADTITDPTALQIALTKICPS